MTDWNRPSFSLGFVVGAAAFAGAMGCAGVLYRDLPALIMAGIALYAAAQLAVEHARYGAMLSRQAEGGGR